jgi:hypothetical protein
MSFTGYEDAISAYTNQVSTYKEELNQYKDQLAEFKGQLAQMSFDTVAGIAAPFIIEKLGSPAFQNAVGSLFIRTPAKDGTPEAEAAPETEPAPVAPEAATPMQAAPASPWERPANLDQEGAAEAEQIPTQDAAAVEAEQIPTQDDLLDAAATRAPEEVTADMLPEGAGEIVGGSEGMIGGVATQAEEAVGQLAGAAEGMATQAVGQLAGAAEGLVTQAGEALTGAATQVVGQLGWMLQIIAFLIRQLVYQQQKQGLYHARVVTKD